MDLPPRSRDFVSLQDIESSNMEPFFHAPGEFNPATAFEVLRGLQEVQRYHAQLPAPVLWDPTASYLGGNYFDHRVEALQWLDLANPPTLELAAIDQGLQMMTDFGSLHAIPPIVVNESPRAVSYALQWYELVGKKAVEDFLWQYRGQPLTKEMIGSLAIEVQKVLAWEQARPKKQYFNLTFEQYVREIRDVPFCIMDLPPELRVMIFKAHIPDHNTPIDMTDMLHDKQRLSRNAPTMLNHQTRSESFDMAWSGKTFVFRVANGPGARTISFLDPLATWLHGRGDDVVVEISAIIICCSTKPPRGRGRRSPLLHFDELEAATANIRATFGFAWGGDVMFLTEKIGHVCDDSRGHVVLT